MATSWYFARDGMDYGPFSVVEIKDCVTEGRLRPGDTVWKEGMTTQVLASKVQHLFTDAQLHPPAPPVDLAPVPTPPPAEPAAAERPPAPAAAPSPPRPPPPARQKRVLGIKGGQIMSQDGAMVRYRKKCIKCGYLDTSMTTTPIHSGFMRVNFFCPKCKKSQQVEIQGVT